tara:strand:+ start:233 stop:739 length:507 start_codon:yes stop_codon:yes gene_type:complete
VKKTYISWDKTGALLHEVMRQIQSDSLKDTACPWRPDYVVGVVRGGCFPAGMYSHYAGVPMYTLKVQLAHGAGENTEDDVEHNAWMEEDVKKGKNILILEDINDSGSTFNWIFNDWGLHNEEGFNVRTACLIENSASEFDCDYVGMTINKIDDPQWIVFPWEEWWNQH